MTLFVVLLFGAGALLVLSALENSPLADTFRSILSGGAQSEVFTGRNTPGSKQ